MSKYLKMSFSCVLALILVLQMALPAAAADNESSPEAVFENAAEENAAEENAAEENAAAEKEAAEKAAEEKAAAEKAAAEKAAAEKAAAEKEAAEKATAEKAAQEAAEKAAEEKAADDNSEKEIAAENTTAEENPGEHEVPAETEKESIPEAEEENSAEENPTASEKAEQEKAEEDKAAAEKSAEEKAERGSEEKAEKSIEEKAKEAGTDQDEIAEEKITSLPIPPATVPEENEIRIMPVPGPAVEETEEGTVIPEEPALTEEENAQALLDTAKDPFDNSTSFPDGEYEAQNEGMILYENPRGLLTLYCLKIRVEDGKAYGLIGSTSVGYVWIAPGSENAAHYPSVPVTDAKGTNAKTETEIPIRINEEMTIFCMSSRGVSSYQITILAAAPTETPEPTETPDPTETPELTEIPEPEDDGLIPNKTTVDAGTYEADDPEATIITDPDVRATLKCSGITVRDGRAYAHIAFTTNNYDTFIIEYGEKTEEGEFDYSGEHSEAEIPVVFDEEMKLTAHRMSNDKFYTYPIVIPRPSSMPEEKEVPEPTGAPDETPTPKPTEKPTPKPTAKPTPKPTATPTPTDIPVPTEDPKASKTVISKDGDYKINTVPLDEEEARKDEKGLHHIDTGGLGRFRITDCVLHVKDGEMYATITLSGTGYGYLFMGSKSDAEKAEAAAGGDPAKAKGVIPEKARVTNSLGTTGSQFEIPVSSLDKEIYFAARGREKWYQRGIFISSKDLPVKIVETDEEEEPVIPDNNDDSGNKGDSGNKDGDSSGSDSNKDDRSGRPDSNTNGSTRAVDNNTSIPDGFYTPDSFSWSGGNGHINILCDQIEIRGGKAYARITITSGYYQYIKAGGGTHYTTHGSGTSTAWIPVELNKNNRILALTTKLSQPYEIAYTIFVGLRRAGAEEAVSVDEQREKMDADAPAIPGLENGKEMETSYSDLLKIFRYDGGYVLLEIDIAKGTGYNPDAEETEKSAEDAAPAEDASSEADAAPAEDASFAENEPGSASDDEEISAADLAVQADAAMKADVYRHRIVKYLIIPEGGEIPAGMDKEVVIIESPVISVSASTDKVLTHLAALHLVQKITSVGLAGAESVEAAAAQIRSMFPGNESLSGLADRIEKSAETQAAGDSAEAENLAERVLLAGDPSSPDLRTLVALSTGIVFVDSSVLPSEKDAEEEAKIKIEQYETVTSLAAQLGIPYIVWRSQDEKDEKAGAEWYKALGCIFGCEKEAEKLFKEAEEKASK